ncbi:MAG TPA: MmcQ/YjbR family DNA-binding protein [Alloacidobacterium sp.]|nr:MmcQ/YjbR family DNA-binding protein [Alloacidobacterium sp.]
MTTEDDPRLAQVTAICIALPDGTRCDKGEHAAFTVRKKVFAYFLNNHHGDGIVSVCTKALPGENIALVEAHPRKFYLPAYIGPRGWIGLRLDRGKIDWNEVRDLLTASYLQVAPKRLASQVEAALSGLIPRQ